MTNQWQRTYSLYYLSIVPKRSTELTSSLSLQPLDSKISNRTKATNSFTNLPLPNTLETVELVDRQSKMIIVSMSQINIKSLFLYVRHVSFGFCSGNTLAIDLASVFVLHQAESQVVFTLKLDPLGQRPAKLLTCNDDASSPSYSTR